jgi:hypothetical protein
LLAAVDLLESNWKLFQEVLQLTCRMLMRMFVSLWPKKKEEMPVDNLKKLAEAFNTREDHVLAIMAKKWIGRKLALPVLVLCQSCLGSSRRQRSTRQALYLLLLLRLLL